MRFQGLQFRIERVDGRRITSVTITPVEDPDDGDEADGDPVRVERS